MSAKAVVGFSDFLSVSASTGSTTGLGIDAATRKRFASTTHPRKWLRINEGGKLNYITVSSAAITIASVSLLLDAFENPVPT